MSSANAQIADPSDLSGLVLWTDAQDVNGNGTVPANGASISTWTDKSGNGHHLTTSAGTVTYESTGFDGVNPGLRFPLVARMAGPNIFSGSFQNAMTVFFVNANVTLTSNFSLSLNGTQTGVNIADGRFSFHTPYSNNIIFFDSGACCGSTRLEGNNPNALTETTLYTGLNNEPGNSQLLRIDGRSFRSDSTGHNANVTRGVHIGDLPDGHTYNGRFAEVVVYDRALSAAEILDVECYLLAKWKPGDALAGCVEPLSVTKNSAVWTPAGGLGHFAIPGNDIRYNVTVSKPASAGVLRESLFLVDSLLANVAFYNGDVDDGGLETNPVGFSQVGTGVTFNYTEDVAFSNLTAVPTSFAACTYVPTTGYDVNIRHVCVNPKGALLGSSGITSFTIFFRAGIP